MRICMLAESLPPAFGGAAYQALRLAAALRDQGVEIFFLGRRPDDVRRLEPLLDGFPVFRVGIGTPKSGKWAKFRALAGYLTVLFRERYRYDILHIHGPYYLTLVAGFFARAVLGKKLLLKLTLLGYDTPSAVKCGHHGRIAWHYYRRADAYACMSTALLEECRHHGLPAARLFKTPNGVDTVRFCPVTSDAERMEIHARLNLSADFRYAVFIGSVEKRKGVDFLIEVAADICRKHTDVKFLLIGPDGSREVEKFIDRAYVRLIRSRIEQLGLTDRILMLGHRSDSRDYLRAARAFVFTSRSEGFGTALIEAMAAGLPCVALNLPGVTSDIVSNGVDGITIAGEVQSDFVAAIDRIFSDADWAGRLGRAARDRVVKDFDMSVVALRYVRLYRSLLKDDLPS